MEAEVAFGIFSFIMALQWLSFVFSALLQSEVFFDLLGTFTFFIVSCITLAIGGTLHDRQVLVTTFGCVWAVRLGSYLLMRIITFGRDSRFDGVRDKPSLLFAFWTIQGLWVFAISTPVMLLNIETNHSDWGNTLDLTGLLFWIIGFLVEAVADYQKFVFKSDAMNECRWIDTGLWRFSRHPNYLGEIFLQWGLYISSVSSLQRWDKLLALIGPITTQVLLLHVSGIPLLEKKSKVRWGGDPAFEGYLQTTPVLIPSLLSISSSLSTPGDYREKQQ